MYYIFLNADPYEHVGKIQKRRKENLSYIYTWFFENRATKKCQSLALIVNLMALVT